MRIVVLLRMSIIDILTDSLNSWAHHQRYCIQCYLILIMKHVEIERWLTLIEGSSSFNVNLCIWFYLFFYCLRFIFFNLFYCWFVVFTFELKWLFILFFFNSAIGWSYIYILMYFFSRNKGRILTDFALWSEHIWCH